jgi:hypothetical protein
MATYNELLRERLAQISNNAEALTTWEQLKAQRDRQKRQAAEALTMLNGQTSAYQQQLRNLGSIYNSTPLNPTPSFNNPSKSPSTTKKKPPKKKKNTSLGDSLGDIADIVGGALR